MTEPTLQRGNLWFWLILSLTSALAIIGLGVGLEPHGASVLRAPLHSPAAGAFGFGLLLVWAAFAYALSAGRAAGSRDLALAALNLGLPLLLMVLWLRDWNSLALPVAVGWSASLVVMGIRLFQREAIAGVMVLPILGASLTGMMFSLTLWLLPAARAGSL